MRTSRNGLLPLVKSPRWEIVEKPRHFSFFSSPGVLAIAVAREVFTPTPECIDRFIFQEGKRGAS